jgi:hypothetical protein
MKKLIPILLLAAPCLGQAIHLTGGESTLQNAEGGGATFFLPGNQVYIGGGRGIGIADKLTYDHLDFILGDSAFNYAVDGASTAIFSRGVKVEKKSNDQTFGTFAGLVGLSYTVPFFSAMQEARSPGAGFYYYRKLGKWKFNSLEVFSHQKTLIQSARYDGNILQFFANGGLIQNLWQSSGTFIFRPVREFNLSGSDTHQLNYKSENLSALASKAGFQLHGSGNWEAYLSRESRGATIGAAYSHGWIQVRSDLYKSSNQHQLIVNSLTEQTRHWSATQAINNSNQFQYGGSYHNNSVQLSFNHAIAFIPGQGYQQFLSVGIAFKIHDSQVNTQEYLLPGNKFKFAAYGDQWAQGPIQSESPSHHMHKSIGKELIVGTVTLQDGTPVEGIAIKVGRETVFTDVNGIWQYRSKKKISPTICIDLEESWAPGDWEVVIATDSRIVVRRK